MKSLTSRRLPESFNKLSRFYLTMPREFKRSSRVADAIQRSLATLIPKEVRDPRIAGMVNVNEVVVSKDLSTAKVYVTFIGVNDKKQCEQSAEILNKAASFLRSLVGKDIVMRSTPKISFFYDDTAVKGANLSQLINQALACDNSEVDEHHPSGNNTEE